MASSKYHEKDTIYMITENRKNVNTENAVGHCHEIGFYSALMSLAGNAITGIFNSLIPLLISILNTKWEYT